MVDTLVITLHYPQDFEILPSCFGRFSPNVRNFFIPPYAEFGSKKTLKAECNPSSADKASGQYYPRLTLFKAVRAGGIATFLRVEVSLPKLLFLNNFDEICDLDFGLICETLYRRLSHYGVQVKNASTIKNADVSAIHYGKNVALTDWSTPSLLIKQLSKVNMNRWKDVRVSDYQNTGQAVRFHTRTWELIFYDKIKDLQQAKIADDRAFSRDNYTQLNLFEETEFIKPFEVIRIEARYGDRKKITEKLKAAGLDPPPLIFEHLYSEKIAQAVLKKELSEVKARYPPILLSKSQEAAKLLVDLKIHNPNSTLYDRLTAIGYQSLLKEVGCGDIRNFGTDKPHEWYKFQAKMKKLNFTKSDDDPFEVLEKAVEVFGQLRLKDFTTKMPAKQTKEDQKLLGSPHYNTINKLK